MQANDHDGYEVEHDSHHDEMSGHHAPPTMPGEISSGMTNTAWPTVIGVIGVIIAAWGLLGSVCGGVALAGFGAMGGFSQFANIPGTGLTGLALAVTVLKLLVTLGLAIYLLIGSISLLKRQRVSASQLVTWAWARIGLGVVLMVLELATTNFGQISQQPGGAQVPQGVVIGSVIFGVAIGLVFMLWFPLLLIIWFKRPVIQQEVSQWP